MPAIKELHQVGLRAALASGKVTSKGMADVSILTGDMEAAGHGFYIDQTSISQLNDLLAGKSLSAYLTHEDAGEDRLGQEVGVFSDFYLDGETQLRAKSFKFMDSFMEENPKEHKTLVQLAKDFPDQLGVSPVIRYGLAWVCDDGEELDADENERPANAVRALPSARIGGVRSADFVKNPAANVAFYSQI